MLAAASAPEPVEGLALHEIARGGCASAVAERTGRHPQTVMGWLHRYNEGGPEAVRYRRTGGRPPLCPEIQAALGAAVCAAQREAAGPPVAGADPKPRWTLKRLVGFVRARFARPCCRETIRAALHRLGLSWKKAKKLLGRADPARREAFIARLRPVLAAVQRDRYQLVYLDEAQSTKTPTSAADGACAASASMSPRPRRAWPPRPRSMAFISITRAKCGCGPTRAPMASTPPTCCAGCAPSCPTASWS